jgi:hypothetical protein
MFGMVTGAVITASAIAAALELPSLIKRKQLKEAVAYVLMFVAGTFLVYITGISNDLPSPFQLLVWVYKPVNDWVATMFSGGG